ncbi:MAG TPA: ABC transporter permease [Mucilaginibacter sp.]|nr:ABC transporter permease [Mucilaginibacter sp.]
MLKNYIKITWRNLVKNRFYSVINIAGLTVGMAIGILILLWVQNELSFDNFHHKGQNIYRVNSFLGSGTNKRVWSTTQGTIAPYALNDIPGVINAVRVIGRSGDVYSYKDKLLKEDENAYVDPSFFKMFDFKLISGNVNQPFPDEHSVIITESTARKYFGDEQAVGKVLQEDHQNNYTVSGVIADFPDNSSLQYNMLFPVKLLASQYSEKDFWKSLDTDWGNFYGSTFLEVQPGVSTKMIGRKLIQLQIENAPQIKATVKDNAYQLQKLASIHLYGPDGSEAGMQTVSIFLIVGILILIIACINYVNLSTARSMLRAKEVSIRKIVGAQKKQLFIQFVVETFIFFCISLFFSFILIEVLLPYYNDLSGKHLQLDLTNPGLWKVVFLTITGTLTLASVYPALLLSSFDPLKALKGKLTLGLSNVLFRKALVTIQFVFSVVLIITTLVIGRQLKYVHEKDPGYDRSQVFSFPGGEMEKHLDEVKTMLLSHHGIEAVSAADNRLVNNGHTTGGISWDGKDPNSSVIFHHLGIDENFIPMMKIQLTAGRNFSGSKTDSAHFILNETALRAIGIRNPIGKHFKFQETEGTIIGVTKDFNTASFKERIEPTVIYYEPKGWMLYIKTSERNASKAINATATLWKQFNPGFPFEYSFMDEEYAKLYRSDQRTGELFNIFSAIAILISCLGLLGLATYTAQIMTKEIGIRKVLGASVGNIVALVSKDFLKLVSLAIVIGSPLAWWAMSRWLQTFVYRIGISWAVFFVAASLAIGIAILTVGFQSIKAALVNPVKSLRSE